MIDNSSFTAEWINDRSELFKIHKRKADPQLIEKLIHALYLLENLAKSQLKFIFKGGTALILLLNKIHRFSIDIDIIIEDGESRAKILDVLDEITRNSDIFYRFEENERIANKNISKAHYKFYYKSILDNSEKYILLDILFEKNPYEQIIEKDICNDFIKIMDEPVLVNMPSIDCILGDKLTAYAPNTTGIPYGKNKELEIIKQLFDISNLFDEMKDLETIKRTFENIAKLELGYRELRHLTTNDVLNDILETSIIIAFRGARDIDKYSLLESGVKKIKGYIFTRNFIVEDAVTCAAKAAYLSLLLLRDDYTFDYFDNKIDLSNLNITDLKFAKSFKSIKKFSPEAYYYWYKAIELYKEKDQALSDV